MVHNPWMHFSYNLWWFLSGWKSSFDSAGEAGRPAFSAALGEPGAKGMIPPRGAASAQSGNRFCRRTDGQSTIA
jgi:hypothetical protein